MNLRHAITAALLLVLSLIAVGVLANVLQHMATRP